MSAELDVDDGTARSLSAFDMVVLGIEPLEHRRPNVSGDLPTVFRAAPMFRRAPIGYDRFQVDTYVQWAEEELASAEREHEHLVARHLRTRADLEEARELLAHSSGGGEMLRLSRRIGSILAAAADEAESMRAEAESTKAEAEACRSAASAEAERMVAHAEVLIADAGAEADRMVATAAHEAEEMATEAGRILDRAERMSAEARAEAAARLEEVRAVEQRAVEHAGELRQQAVAEAAAARLQAREEIVRMLSTGREERRRADAAAAASSERLLRDTAARYAALLTEVQALEHRRAVLRAEVELLAEPVAAPTRRRRDVQLHRHLDRLGWRIRSLRAP